MSVLVADTPDRVGVVYNKRSDVSRRIARYYQQKRDIPANHVFELNLTTEEEISREEFEEKIAEPLIRLLKERKLTDQIYYLVTTSGVPLKIAGSQESSRATAASVDSELTLLYERTSGKPAPNPEGPHPNPFFGKDRIRFSHAEFPIYLVTRLTGYTFEDVRRLIDRSLAAQNRGEIVIDQLGDPTNQGDQWLEQTVRFLPASRVFVDRTPTVVTGRENVIGFASWGSNDAPRRTQHIRYLRFQWLPGAIMTEFVSTNGRSFQEPPKNWTIGGWDENQYYFKGSPQTMAGDYIREGVSGASAHVYEPYLQYNPRPQILFPAYLAGRNLAESYYVAMPGLSWMNVIIGDPLCRLEPRK